MLGIKKSNRKIRLGRRGGLALKHLPSLYLHLYLHSHLFHCLSPPCSAPAPHPPTPTPTWSIVWSWLCSFGTMLSTSWSFTSLWEASIEPPWPPSAPPRLLPPSPQCPASCCSPHVWGHRPTWTQHIAYRLWTWHWDFRKHFCQIFFHAEWSGMTYLATHLMLRCLHLSYEFTPLYFTVILIFPLFCLGRASSTISMLSKSDSSTAFHFPAALELLTFLAFSVSAASYFFFSSSAAAAATASAASLSFLSSSTHFCSASSLVPPPLLSDTFPGQRASPHWNLRRATCFKA